MAYRSLEITLVSAKGLKDVNILTKMAVYAVVSVSCNSPARQRTPADRKGGRNPSFVSYQVRRTGSGKPKGVLNFSYRLGERVEAPPARHSRHPTSRRRRNDSFELGLVAGLLVGDLNSDAGFNDVGCFGF